ncbi:unnamed protein product, partial [Iphiclides podalirius]
MNSKGDLELQATQLWPLARRGFGADRSNKGARMADTRAAAHCFTVESGLSKNNRLIVIGAPRSVLRCRSFM